VWGEHFISIPMRRSTQQRRKFDGPVTGGCKNHVLVFSPCRNAGSALQHLTPRRSPRVRPSTARGRTDRSPRARLPTQRDIDQMRDQINASRKTIVWSDRSDTILSKRMVDEVESPRETPPRKRIMLNMEPIDISKPPEAAPLISTTAGVLDLCDVPNSLSFIR
jgi:hypothetical protein